MMSALTAAAPIHALLDTSWDHARALAAAAGERMAGTRAQRSELVPLAEAAGRELAVDLVAQTDLPRFAVSAMDGWVVRGAGPWRVGRSILAGDPPSRDLLRTGTARPIATGGVVPPGSSAVLRLEHGEVRIHGSREMLFALTTDSQPGRDIRPAGEEARRGDVLLRARSVLTVPRIALAAVSGYDRVEVIPMITADVVILGDEVRTGMVRDAYAHALPAAIETAGGRVGRVTMCADDPDSTRSALGSATGEILITTGGTAHGPTDFARSALIALNARFLFDGVAMRPGHPVIMAEMPGGSVVVCLPGNPLAAMLCFASFVVPWLDATRGRPTVVPPPVRLATAIPNATRSSRLAPCTLGDGGASPTGWQGPGMLRGLSRADLVVVVPIGGADAGSFVPTLALPW